MKRIDPTKLPPAERARNGAGLILACVACLTREENDLVTRACREREFAMRRELMKREGEMLSAPEVAAWALRCALVALGEGAPS